MVSKDEAEKNISGNTLRVYVYVLKNGPSELRQVQRGLGFSTPSLASYHLNKLIKAGYLRQDEEGRYVANGEVTPSLLEEYSKVGSFLVPNMLFFATLFTILIAYFSFRALTVFRSASVEYLAVSSIAMCGAYWYEVVRVWRKLLGMR
ncbi:MAG: hypothetical protein QXP58_03415 [Thermoprotei archaeon]